MKRWICLFLGLVMMWGAAVPGLAETLEPAAVPEEPAEDAVSTAAIRSDPVGAETADARLARITEIVKNTLDLDTEAYTEFRGNVSEAMLGNLWNLNWSAEDRNLTVEALEDGTVVGYWSNEDENYWYYSPHLPTFPGVDTERAKQAAEAFLAKVLDSRTEAIQLEDPASSNQLNSRNCSFYGTILLNGLPSPLSYNLLVRETDYAVSSFHRDAPANSFLGAIPSPVPAVSEQDAAARLKETLNLELIYVASGEDEHRAVLRYVPKDQKTLYVDAQTGKLVDPYNERTYETDSGGGVEQAAMDSAALSSNAKRLTEVELTGVQKLEGVLDSAELDKRIRQESAYQLDGFTVNSANYRIVKEGDEPEDPILYKTADGTMEDAGKERVLCNISYTETGSEKGETRWKNFTVDARTGEVQSMNATEEWNKDRKPAVTVARAQEIATAFLGRFTIHAEEMELYRTDDNTADGAPFYHFNFARKANGYFFPANAANISIDCMTGAVSGVNLNWTDKLAFDSTSGIVSAGTALNAWMGTYTVTLGYGQLSKELDPKVDAEAKLIDRGYTRFQTLFLCYRLEREDYCPGVDAKTGRPVIPEKDGQELSYSDVAGIPAEKDITRLAAFGVGYDGGVFQPEKPLTQWDAVCLLASTQGYRLNPNKATENDKKSAYNTVYNMGALTRAERNDNAAMTRGTLVKLLLNAAGYRETAALKGIFTCSYLDRSIIPAEDLGYAALAQGLGLASGIYGAGTAAERADAALMLCRIMER